jgi:hypothetical protein
MLPRIVLERDSHPLLTQQMSIVLLPAPARKGVFAHVWAGVRETVLAAAGMVAVCWIVAVRGGARAAGQMSHAAITVTCAKAANLGHVARKSGTRVFGVDPTHVLPQMGRVLPQSARMAVGHLQIFSDRGAKAHDQVDHPA